MKIFIYKIIYKNMDSEVKNFENLLLTFFGCENIIYKNILYIKLYI